MRFRFPFRRDNRRPDGFWDAPDATGDNIKGTSVDPYDPVWPRWKQTPPDHGEGEFISEEPFFDIDEIMQRADFYPPGRPLVDKSVGGNPASRQRVGDMPGGNLSRRRLLVARDDAGQIVGTATVVVFTKTTGVQAWLEDVVVDDSARGQGIGAALTARAIEIARQHGARYLDLTSSPRREAANRLYQRLGFTQRTTNVYRFDLRT